MTDTEAPDKEPASPAFANEPVQERKRRAGRKALASARRDLSEQELGSPAVSKLFMDDIERLEDENQELRDIRDKYHQADVRVSVLEEKHRKVISQEIVSGGCLAVGSAAIGFIPSVASDLMIAMACGVFGSVLVVVSIVAAVRRPRTDVSSAAQVQN